MDELSPLPRSLDPLPDEVLPGYLLRLAHRLDRILRCAGDLLGTLHHRGELQREGIRRSGRALHSCGEAVGDGATLTVMPDGSFADRYTLWVAF